MTDEGTVRITLPANLDIYQRDAIAAMLPHPRTVERLIIDCSQAPSIESTIITLLLRYRRQFVEAGNDPTNLVIVASPTGRRSLDIVGLPRAMTVLTAPVAGSSTGDPAPPAE